MSTSGIRPIVRPDMRRCTPNLAQIERRAARSEVTRLIAKFPNYYDAAIAVGVSVRTICRWASQATEPCLSEYRAIRRALGEDPDDAIPDSRRVA